MNVNILRENIRSHHRKERKLKQQYMSADTLILEAMKYTDVFYLNYHRILVIDRKLFNKLLLSPNHQAKMINALNVNRENLLHLSSRLNISEFIPTLLEQGCNPAKQDCNGRTPLHTALQYKNTECVRAFLQVMKTIQENDKLNNGLQDMFKVYDQMGHTILHMVVVKHFSGIFMDLLRFCQRWGIDVLEYEVLGSGDSLLHLALKENNFEVVKIITELVPDSLKARNYRGELAYDTEALSSRMQELDSYCKHWKCN